VNIRLQHFLALGLVLCQAPVVAQDESGSSADSRKADTTVSSGSPNQADVTPPPSTIISRDVLVAAGDTLKSIAARELGRVGFAPQLAEFNALVTNAPLISGNIIRIPIHVPARGEFATVIFVKGDVKAMRPEDLLAAAQVTTGTPTAVAATVSTGTMFSTSARPAATAQPVVIALTRDIEVHSGDTIITGSDGYVSIEFSSGSVINMQPNTETLLSRLNCLPADDSCVIEIRTLKGKVTSDIDARDSQPVDFRISTPYASAAVRGTVFDVDAGDALRVGVTEGAVDLSAQQQNVGLNTGFGSIVQEGQPPSQPVALLPAPVFKRVPARVASGDAVTWWPFSDAASYGALLANDEAGNETLASYDVNEDSIEFATVDSGDYFLLLRAIDNNGLQGFTSNTRITIADIDDTIRPVATTVTRQGSEFLVIVQDPPVNAAGFEIQIATSEAFDDPLSVDVNANGSAVFRLDNDRVFTRARVLLDPYTVSAYGAIASSQ
jgi:hypothetical protein